MRRARFVALTAVLTVAGGAGAGTASADQPGREAVDAPAPAERVWTDRHHPELRFEESRLRTPGSMPHVLPRGPRAVPMPELLRSGPRPVPMPRLGPDRPFDAPLDGPRALPGSGEERSQVIPEELEDSVETLVP